MKEPAGRGVPVPATPAGDSSGPAVIGHVEGGAMRIRPLSSSRVRRPPPRLTKNAHSMPRCGACTTTASPRSVGHRLDAGLGSARGATEFSAGDCTARGGAGGWAGGQRAQARLVTGCQLAHTGARPAWRATVGAVGNRAVNRWWPANRENAGRWDTWLHPVDGGRDLDPGAAAGGWSWPCLWS
jgi:hypothetical protein